MPANMTPERWQQVKSVFHRARELASEERSAFLYQACSTDHSLRLEVESLLSSDEEARSVMPEWEMTRATLVEGTKLGDYEVQSLLGSGGMGVVYRALDLRLGRDVAIKVLPLFFASDRNRLRRFEQEARAAAALNHPNILAVYQLGTYEGLPYIVSELLQGKTLRAQVNRGPIPLEEALEYARQIARGLRVAHEKGIVHRDLKPENLFLTLDGQVKILDFGLAKQTRSGLVETKSAALVTEAGVVMGTVGYMSPEQVRGKTSDFRSDIFAFGTILYEMLSGNRAFTGESSADVASAILKENPPSLSRSVANVPTAVESIVERCLKKDPEARFQSAEELTAALREIETPSNRRLSVAYLWRRMHSSRPLAASVAVLAIVIAALFIYVRYFRSGALEIDSIVVMPFVTKGTDSDNDLGDGIAAGVIDSLSQLPNLRVMARSSVSNYKGREVDPRNIGRELNVRAVLTGKLTPQGDGFLLDTELLNTSDDTRVWGQQYNLKASNMLTVQTDLASAVSSKLRRGLAAETKYKLTNPGTSNPAAYTLYVKGRYAFDQWKPEHMKESLAFFQQAVERDPTYAQAYAGMADAYSVLGFFRWIPLEQAVEKAKAAAHRALELDPNNAEGHCALGGAAYVHWEWEEAEKETRRCAELGPNLPFAHQYHAFALNSLGQIQEGIAEQKRAAELDPISFVSNSFLAIGYEYARDYDHAIELEKKLIEMDPNNPDYHDRMSNLYTDKRDYGNAADEQEKSLTFGGHADQAQIIRSAYARGGPRGYLKADIALRSNPQRKDDYNPYAVATDYSLLGDKENAFAWLDRAYDSKATGDLMLDILINSQLDNLRPDPRFTALLRRMGFPRSALASASRSGVK